MTKEPYKCGWVAIMGCPNAGKSTLMNSIVGQKVAIVSPRPQTTRNQITGIYTDDEAQIIFIDTPGIDKMRGKINRLLAQSAWQAIESVDAIALVIDADLYARNPAYLLNDLENIKERIAIEERPVFIIANKIDLLADKSLMLPLFENLNNMWPNAVIYPISAEKKEGILDLVSAFKKVVPVRDAEFPDDQLSTVTERFMVSEIIREKLFLHLRQEVPYSLAVEIESWEEDKVTNHLTVHAVIYVARSSHKAIVIGKGGLQLKKVGQEARKEIVGLLNRKVHLALWVKVEENWMENMVFLNMIGLGSQKDY